jgi:hypothetical protein
MLYQLSHVRVSNHDSNHRPIVPVTCAVATFKRAA